VLEGQPGLKNIVTMALRTVMRRGEVFGLQWFDVGLNKAVLHIRSTISRDYKKLFGAPPHRDLARLRGSLMPGNPAASV
jgi:integrase